MLVYLIDDHHLFRSGLRFLLSGLNSDIQFLEANDCEQAVNCTNKDSVDLILLDFYMPGVDGFEALQLVKHHYECSIVVLSSAEDPSLIRETITQGAAGFIPKSSSPEVLVAALRLVLAHGIYLPPHVLNAPRSTEASDEALQAEDKRDEILDQLTPRQLKVLLKASQGKANKVIARELCIAEGTVKAHLSACYRVLGVENRTGAVYATASLGLEAELEPEV